MSVSQAYVHAVPKGDNDAPKLSKSAKKNLKLADDLYRRGKQHEAIDFYKLVISEPEQEGNLYCLYQIADIYRQEFYYADAKEYYYKVIEHGGSSAEYPMIRFWMGEVLMAIESYDEAKFSYQKFINGYEGLDKDYYKPLAEKRIQSCELSKKLMENPLKVKVMNAGENINSAKSDFALVKKDANTVYFSGAHFVSGLNNVNVKGSGKGVYDSIPVPRIFLSDKIEGKWEERELVNIRYNTDALLYWMGTPALTSDGQYMFVTIVEQMAEGKTVGLYRAKWDGKRWSSPQLLDEPFNTKRSSTKHPSTFITGDGAEYLLYSTNAGSPDNPGDYDLYLAPLDNGDLGDPIHLGDIVNTSDGSEESPFYNPNDRILYFSSNGHLGMGGLDIYQAFGDIFTGTFDSVRNIGYPLSTGTNDKFFVQTDSNKVGDTLKRVGYLSSNRAGGFAFKGGTCCDDIYEYEWTVPIQKLMWDVIGTVTDLEKAPVPEATVSLYSKTGELLAVIKANKKGEFELNDFEPGDNEEIEVRLSKPGYQNKSVMWNTKKSFVGSDLDLSMQKNEIVSVLKDDKGKPVENASIKIYGEDGTLLAEITTGKDGEFQISGLDTKGNRYVELVLSKKGYITKTVKWDTTIPFNEANLDLILERIELPIVYYEFDRYNLIQIEKNKLQAVVRYLELMPNTTLEIVSHTDSKGSNAYNLRLSEKRTNYVLQHVVKKGVDIKRLKGKWEGEEKPLVSNKSKLGRDHNRRTQFGMVLDEELWAESGTSHIDFNMYDENGDLVASTETDDGSTPKNYDPAKEEKATADVNEKASDKGAKGLYYKVQIGAFSDPGLTRFEKLSVANDIKIEKMNKIIYRFVVGEFSTIKEAEVLRQKMIQEGIKDAWIVPYRDGARITMVEVKKILKAK